MEYNVIGELQSVVFVSRWFLGQVLPVCVNIVVFRKLIKIVITQHKITQDRKSLHPLPCVQFIFNLLMGNDEKTVG